MIVGGGLIRCKVCSIVKAKRLDIDNQEWLKFGYFTENTEKLQQIREMVSRWGTLEITNSHPSNMEMNPLGISKASGC